jgi:hypothetical protein
MLAYPVLLLLAVARVVNGRGEEEENELFESRQRRKSAMEQIC